MHRELEKNSKLERERMLETVQHYTKKPLPRINQLKYILYVYLCLLGFWKNWE